MRKRTVTTVVAAVVAVIVLAGGAAAASQYVITSIKQIKPSVLKRFQPVLGYLDKAGPVATMCAATAGAVGQCQIGSSDARCPTGGTATGGGLYGGQTPPVLATIAYDQPDNDGRGWHVIMINDNTAASASIQATVVCIGSPRQALAARAGAPRSVRAQISDELTALRDRAR